MRLQTQRQSQGLQGVSITVSTRIWWCCWWCWVVIIWLYVMKMVWDKILTIASIRMPVILFWTECRRVNIQHMFFENCGNDFGNWEKLNAYAAQTDWRKTSCHPSRLAIPSWGDMGDYLLNVRKPRSEHRLDNNTTHIKKHVLVLAASWFGFDCACISLSVRRKWGACGFWSKEIHLPAKTSTTKPTRKPISMWLYLV